MLKATLKKETIKAPSSSSEASGDSHKEVFPGQTLVEERDQQNIEKAIFIYRVKTDFGQMVVMSSNNKIRSWVI